MARRVTPALPSPNIWRRPIAATMLRPGRSRDARPTSSRRCVPTSAHLTYCLWLRLTPPSRPQPKYLIRHPGPRRLLGDDLLGPVIQRRIGLPEKRSAGGIVKHDLLQGLASDRILELNLMTKEVPSMQADSWFRRRTSSE